MLAVAVIAMQILAMPDAHTSKFSVLLSEPMGMGDTKIRLRVPFSSVPLVELRFHFYGMIPGSSRLGAVFFDSSGRRTGGSTFHLGWRAYPEKVYQVENDWFSNPLIRVDSGLDSKGCFQETGTDSIRITLALSPTRAYLVKLEDSRGPLLPNAFGADNWTIGPLDEHRYWRADINSADACRQLAGLTWLGGSHETRRELELSQERLGYWVAKVTFEDADAYTTARKDAKAMARVIELMHSKNPWVRRQAGWTRSRMLLPPKQRIYGD